MGSISDNFEPHGNKEKPRSALGMADRSGYNQAVEALKLAKEGADLNYSTINTSRDKAIKIPYRFVPESDEGLRIIDGKKLDLECAKAELVLQYAERGKNFNIETMEVDEKTFNVRSAIGMAIIEFAGKEYNAATEERDAFLEAGSIFPTISQEKPERDTGFDFES